MIFNLSETAISGGGEESGVEIYDLSASDISAGGVYDIPSFRTVLIEALIDFPEDHQRHRVVLEMNTAGGPGITSYGATAIFTDVDDESNYYPMLVFNFLDFAVEYPSDNDSWMNVYFPSPDQVDHVTFNYTHIDSSESDSYSSVFQPERLIFIEPYEGS